MTNSHPPATKDTVHHGDFYTQVRLSFASDRGLSDKEFRLLVVMRCHDLPDARNNSERKGYVEMGRAYLADKLGISDLRRVSRLLESLEQKGYLRREGQTGQRSKIYLLGPYSPVPLGQDDQGSPEPRGNSTISPLVKNAKGPLVKSTNQRKRTKKKNEEVLPALGPSDTQRAAELPANEQEATSPKTPDPRVRLLLVYFCKRYLEKLGCKYPLVGQRDAAVFKALLATHDQPTIERAIDLFLDDPDPWPREAGFTVLAFKSRFARYALQLVEKQRPQGLVTDREVVPPAHRRLAL